MPDRLRLALIFGGRSVEHEVSVVSAEHVMAAADPSRFEVIPIGVAPDGTWLSADESREQLGRDEAAFHKRLVSTGARSLAVALPDLESADVVFPLIHGQHGEDGTLQGLLELLNIPYIGCGVAASAIGMDKALMKSVFSAGGLPVSKHVLLPSISDHTEALSRAREIEETIAYPAFVKPANGGSSLGVSKVRDREGLAAAIIEAGLHDSKVLVEAMLVGREVECGILGNRGNAQASPVGEVRYKRDFYDYEAKYLDSDTEVIAPADLTPDEVARVQELALRAFEAVDGAGLSRIDCFLQPDGSLVIEEINTIPGFTPLSMYPRLWQAGGVSYSELITRLVELALARHREKPIV